MSCVKLTSFSRIFSFFYEFFLNFVWFQKKVLHRDIKPENILLDEFNNIKLTDFGLAKEIKGEERLYECVGTPGYLAPEVLEAGMCERNECDGYSFEVDAWACGVVMYTLLVGKLIQASETFTYYLVNSKELKLNKYKLLNNAHV